MGLMKELLCVVSILIYHCNAHSYRLSGCPKVKVMKDFEMEKFLGDWFVVGRFNALASCIKINVEKDPQDQISMSEGSRPFGIYLGHDSGPRKGRKITVISNDTDAIFTVQRKFFNFGLKTFGVVDTDYSQYAVVWGCDPLVMGSIQNLDVLSRTPDVKKDAVKELAEKAKVDLHSLEYVNHQKCGTPEEETKPVKNEFNNMFVEQ